MSGKPYPTAPPGSYPGQPVYPQGGYPQAPYLTGYPYQQPYGTPGPAQYNPPPYSQAPPPYSQYPSAGLPQGMYGPQYPQPQTVYAPGLYDSGARFDGVSQPYLPPPPPGVAPNAAQMAAMQGHTVVGTQANSNWLTGGRNDGGFSFGF